MEEHSIFISELLTNSYQCSAMIILPQLPVNTVRLAVSLLDGGEGDVKIVKDIAQTVTPVFTLLGIPFTIPDSLPDIFLNITSGHVEISVEVNKCYTSYLCTQIKD